MRRVPGLGHGRGGRDAPAGPRGHPGRDVPDGRAGQHAGGSDRPGRRDRRPGPPERPERAGPGALLLAGEPGVGKSTLLLETGALVAEAGPVLYVTGEESAAQVRSRADRIGAVSDQLFLAAETDLDAVLGQ